jgi:hypothetical protein
MALNDLPDGVYERDGHYYHDVPRTVVDGGQEFLEWVPREVAFVLTTDETLIAQARERAARARHPIDFWDPRVVNGHIIGWLVNGRKRQQEWPENLGAGTVTYRRTPVVRDDDQPVVPRGRGRGQLVGAGQEQEN